jgi:hypothetical protein
MRKALLAIVLATVSLAAEPVYITAHGKTFHKATTCGILARSAKVFQADRAAAESHGLKPCHSCYSVHKADNGAWSKEVKK